MEEKNHQSSSESVFTPKKNKKKEFGSDEGQAQIEQLASSSKKNLESSESIKNPFSSFIDDSDSKNLLKICQQKNISTASPKGESSNTPQKSENKAQASKRLMGEYTKLIEKMESGEEFHLMPIAFRENINHDKSNLTKFICFQINKRNGKSIQYCEKKGTCVSLYNCFGCSRIFEKPSALGGHLSKCEFKQIHFQHIYEEDQKVNPKSYYLEIHDSSQKSSQIKIKKILKPNRIIRKSKKLPIKVLKTKIQKTIDTLKRQRKSNIEVDEQLLNKEKSLLQRQLRNLRLLRQRLLKKIKIDDCQKVVRSGKKSVKGVLKK